MQNALLLISIVLLYVICFIAFQHFDTPAVKLDLHSATGAWALGVASIRIAQENHVDLSQLNSSEWHTLLVSNKIASSAPSPADPQVPWHDSYGSPYQWIVGDRIPGGWAIVSLGRDGVPGGAQCDDLVITEQLINAQNGKSVLLNVSDTRKRIGQMLIVIAAIVLVLAAARIRFAATLSLSAIAITVGAWLVVKSYKSLFTFSADIVNMIVAAIVTMLFVTIWMSYRRPVASCSC